MKSVCIFSKILVEKYLTVISLKSVTLENSVPIYEKLLWDVQNVNFGLTERSYGD